MDDYENIGPAQYDGYINEIGAALQAASGSQKRALEAQLESAREARKNAMEIAQLQASTSRYGIDVASRDRMAQLKENARQFDAQHGLEIAKAYTAFASTPDLMWAERDFTDAMGRVGQNLSPRPIAGQPQPHAKTWQDFSALAQYNGSTVPGASSGSGNGAASASNGSGNGAQSTTDPRVSAANAVMKALPPSEQQGHDGQNWAALNAIQSLYFAGKPGVQKLGEARQKIALAGLARLGYDPNLVNEEYYRGLPGQKSPLLSA